MISSKRYVAVMTNDSSDEELDTDSFQSVLTAEDVGIVAQRYTNDKLLRVLDYKIEEYGSYKVGFSGAYSTLNIVTQKKASTQTAAFFVKSIPHTSKEQTDYLKNEGVFFTEYNFYSTLLPELSVGRECEKWHPTCYLAKKSAIVMEDLATEGYRTLWGIFDDFVKLKSILASLARFHGFFILAEARLNQDEECPKILTERYPGSFDEKVYVRSGMTAYFVSASADLTCALAESLNLSYEKIRKAYDTLYDIIKPSKTHRNGVCHGGLHGANFMFADGSPTPKCVLVDFQLLRYAPLVTDILLVLYLNCTRAFREENERIMIEFYRSVLEEAIRSKDTTKTVKVPTLDELLSGVDDLRIFGLISATVYLPTIVMDSNISTEYIENSYREYVYGDRLHLTLAHMKGNPFYKNLLESVVVELVERADVLYE